MGRIKGSKNKPKIGPFNPDNLQAEVMAVFDAPKIDTMADEHPMWDKKNIEHRLPEEIVLEKKISKIIETPYPSNWDKMSKAEKLKWLKS